MGVGHQEAWTQGTTRQMAARKRAQGGAAKTAGQAAPAPETPVEGAEEEVEPAALPPEAPEGEDEEEEAEDGPPPPGQDEDETTPAPRAKAPAAAPGAAQEFNLDDVLGKLSPTDKARLRNHPLIAGIAGQIASTQLPKLVQAELDKRQAEEEEEEDDELLETAPETFVQRQKTRRQQRRERQRLNQEVSKVEGTWRENVRGAVKRFQDELPDEIKAEVEGKFYPGDFYEGLYGYVKDVSDARVRHATRDIEAQLTPRIEARLRKSLRPQIRQEILDEQNAGQPSPDRGRAGRTPNGAANGEITQAVYDAHRQDRAWRMQHRQEINDAVAAGRITH